MATLMIAPTAQVENIELAEALPPAAPITNVAAEQVISPLRLSPPDDVGDWRQRLLALAIFSAVVDFSMPVMIGAMGGPRDWLIVFPFAAVGCTLAQGCTLAAALAWSEGPFWRRLAYHYGACAMLYCSWLAGMLLSARPQQLAEIVPAVGLSVPLVSLGAQLPLWAVRHFFGWRVVRSHSSEGAGEPPLTIRDLMFATLVVAAALGLARLGPIPENVRWILWAMGLTVASVVSAVAMLPAGALLLRNRPLETCLIHGSAYAGSLVGLLWLVTLILWWNAPRFALALSQCVALSCLMLSFAATLTTAAATARACGYQLVWGRRAPRRTSVSLVQGKPDAGSMS